MLLLRTAAGLLAGANAVATEALYTALMAKRVNFMVVVKQFFYYFNNKNTIFVYESLLTKKIVIVSDIFLTVRRHKAQMCGCGICQKQPGTKQHVNCFNARAKTVKVRRRTELGATWTDIREIRNQIINNHNYLYIYLLSTITCT